MAKAKRTDDLEDLLKALERCAKSAGASVSVEEILNTVGRRSFGPLLLLAGLLGMSPVAAVPGAPSTIAVITLLVGAQLLFGRDSIWLPRFMLRLSVKAEAVRKTVRVASRPASFVDKLVRPRLTPLTGPVADRLVALACVLLALMTPPLEFLPFVAFIPAAAIAAFGLGLVARDGALVLLAFLISGGAAGFLAHKLLTG